MTSPAIIPMRPGEVPTEPGWYVARQSGGDPQIVRASQDRDGSLRLLVVGYEKQLSFQGEDVASFTFIARIYPDRIGEEG